MYVDESGDTGLPPPRGRSPTRHFCLTGLVVHELRWQDTLDELLRFRHWLKREYGIYLDDELHTAEMVSKPRQVPRSLARLAKHQRLAVIRHHADQLSRLPDIRLVNVCVDKGQSKYANSNSVFRRAWYALFQRFENTMRRRNFPHPVNEQERGIVFPDKTDVRTLKSHLEAMKLRNPLLVRQRGGHYDSIDEPIRLLIEDPVSRDSKDSYFIQAVDCAVWLFKQHLDPSGYAKKHGANAYFRRRLEPVLCKQASNFDPFGVVRL